MVYLAWVPLGVERLTRFLVSYAANDCGLRHDLIVVYNGFATEADLVPFQNALAQTPHQTLVFPTPNQDIGSYFQAAERLPQRFLCFLNSYCVLCAPGWLAKMQDCLTQTERVGVVGATGSWESLRIHLPVWERSDRERFRHAGLVLRLRNWIGFRRLHYDFPTFPNAHLRTNAFLLERQTLLGLRQGRMRDKIDALRFESGRHSLTRQITAQGQRVLVVGRNSVGYDIPDWNRSGTFRQDDQDNLLVQDNRTEEYRVADRAKRSRLFARAWGDEKEPRLGSPD